MEKLRWARRVARAAIKLVWLGCQFGGDAELVMGQVWRFMQARRCKYQYVKIGWLQGASSMFRGLATQKCSAKLVLKVAASAPCFSRSPLLKVKEIIEEKRKKKIFDNDLDRKEKKIIPTAGINHEFPGNRPLGTDLYNNFTRAATV